MAGSDIEAAEAHLAQELHWGPVALRRGWIANDGEGPGFHTAAGGATFCLALHDDSIQVVTLEIEPDEPEAVSSVRLVSSSGSTLASMNLMARQTLRAVLPAGRADLAEMRIEVEPERGPQRIRVWSIAVRDLATDVVRARRSMTLGPAGWFSLEAFDGEIFRWIDNDASIQFLPAFRATRVAVDLGPGPSITELPMKLFVFDDAGRPLESANVNERCTVQVTVDPAVSRGLRLHIANGGARHANDARILNCQVFGIRALD